MADLKRSAVEREARRKVSSLRNDTPDLVDPDDRNILRGKIKKAPTIRIVAPSRTAFRRSQEKRDAIFGVRRQFRRTLYRSRNAQPARRWQPWPLHLCL